MNINFRVFEFAWKSNSRSAVLQWFNLEELPFTYKRAIPNIVSPVILEVLHFIVLLHYLNNWATSCSKKSLNMKLVT